MKKKILFVFLAVMILAAGLGGGYWIAADAAEDADKPEWQIVVEERVAPLVISAISTVCAWYIANLPAISRINAAAAAASLSASGFDGAAGNVASVAKQAAALVERVEAMEKKIDARYEEEHKMLLSALKMIALGFSHEAELVKNGAAREILQMEEEYEGEE